MHSKKMKERTKKMEISNRKNQFNLQENYDNVEICLYKVKHSRLEKKYGDTSKFMNAYVPPVALTHALSHTCS